MTISLPSAVIFLLDDVYSASCPAGDHDNERHGLCPAVLLQPAQCVHLATTVMFILLSEQQTPSHLVLYIRCLITAELAQ